MNCRSTSKATCLSTRSSSARRHRGMTFIELLVSVAIVGLLVVVLVPAIEQARATSRSTICQNNQRVIGVAFQQYALDNSQLLPQGAYAGFNGATGAPTGQLVPDTQFREWMRLYHPYIVASALNPAEDTDPTVSPNLLELRKETAVFDCPSTYTPVGFFHPVTGYKTKPKVFDYLAYPQKKPGTGGQYYTKLDEMPSNLFLISDARDGDPLYTWGNNFDAQNDVYFLWQLIYIQSSPTVDGSKGYRPGFHHANGLNVLFPSGDVRHLSRQQVQPNYRNNNYTTLTYAP